MHEMYRATSLYIATKADENCVTWARLLLADVATYRMKIIFEKRLPANANEGLWKNKSYWQIRLIQKANCISCFVRLVYASSEHGEQL